ncbi:hypothetical protein BU25DRAFT_212552 [Macroventuria anomochaeta]|uniref:Uncharacterized protein n=1 Tax=Macroventuria anomochaeta TaxID=301207 RepID=A0ACB6RL40_9PLEO|nr:uncharacterized protein BU25DRAFT_212552 [Macroventuria anomochaeta]KAF2622427.1 hypothetical protein BU25DRAFT_212552 [Macroventuria anomochaeta]
MQLSRYLFGLTWLLLPVAFLGTTWLYLYPLFHGCTFPQPNNTSLPLLSSQAPFRLLALGDPQLEGDSSLPDPNAPIFPSLENVISDIRNANFDPPDVRDILSTAAKGAVKDLGAWLEGYRKTVDLWGNDWYLAHIARSLRWWTEPTHISVLGDLLGSQWITDGEFDKRASRYWGTVMRGLEKVPDASMGVYVESDHYDEPEDERKKTWGGTREVLGADKAWGRRVINIAGNHDIGYAGDIDNARVDRFERAFGSVNWDMWLTLPPNTNNTSIPSFPSSEDTATADPPPALRLVILNTMNLDTPAWTDSLQQDTYAFMNHIITTSRPVTDKTHATILLTHVPLHKEPGICVDSPYFDFFEGGHGVREQNMLSEYGSKIVLESIFGLSANKDAEGKGMGRRGVVVNGHDHEGCDVLHYIRQPGAPSSCNADEVERGDAYWPKPTANETDVSIPNELSDDTISANETIPENPAEQAWKARRFPTLPFDISQDNECTHIPSSPHLREITLRSMMGDFSGYAGFLSAWFDFEKGERGEWVIEFSTCGVGVQHWWWGVHIVDLILVVAMITGSVARGVETLRGEEKMTTRTKKGEGSNGAIGGAVVQKRGKVVEMSVEPGAASMQKTRRV